MAWSNELVMHSLLLQYRIVKYDMYWHVTSVRWHLNAIILVGQSRMHATGISRVLQYSESNAAVWNWFSSSLASIVRFEQSGFSPTMSNMSSLASQHVQKSMWKYFLPCSWDDIILALFPSQQSKEVWIEHLMLKDKSLHSFFNVSKRQYNWQLTATRNVGSSKSEKQTITKAC